MFPNGTKVKVFPPSDPETSDGNEQPVEGVVVSSRGDYYCMEYVVEIQGVQICVGADFVEAM